MKSIQFLFIIISTSLLALSPEERYQELLTQYPEKMKREGVLNDHTKGAYEIVYDLAQIREIQQITYNRLLKKYASPELAAEWSRPGVVCEDEYWIWVRDAVIAPSGFRHMYNRLIWKSALEGVGGAAVLPIFIDAQTGVKKISLILTYRHATGAWEFELPRGGAKKQETPADVARRELREETGQEIMEPVFLGEMTPDSGALSSVVPLFSGVVKAEVATAIEETESIAGSYLFSAEEIEAGLLQGYLEVKKGDQPVRAHLRDPFLTYALTLARLRGEL